MKRYRLVFSAVHMVYRLINSTFNTKELLLRLTRLVCQIVHASSSDVYLFDPEKQKIVFIATFTGKINILLDKKADIEKISKEERGVALGDTLVKPRLIGLPLVADDNMGAIFIRRKKSEPPFSVFDKEILSVVAEQAVLAVKNLQLSESQQKTILESIKSIGKFLEKQGNGSSVHAPAYFQVARCIAEKLQMRESEIKCLQYASILHDVGAMDVPYEILSKRSRLTSDEFKIIHDHPAKSVEFIKPVAFLKPVLSIVLYHHEKYDGTGYPSGLKREQIPLGARVISVIDAFEAMISRRPYRRALSIEGAISELKQNSGAQFDPAVVDAFCELAKQKKFRKHLSFIRG